MKVTNDKTITVRHTNNLEKRIIALGVTTIKSFDKFGGQIVCTNYRKNKRVMTVYVNVVDGKTWYSFGVVDFRGKPLYDRRTENILTVMINIEKWLLK